MQNLASGEYKVDLIFDEQTSTESRTQAIAALTLQGLKLLCNFLCVNP